MTLTYNGAMTLPYEGSWPYQPNPGMPCPPCHNCPPWSQNLTHYPQYLTHYPHANQA